MTKQEKLDKLGAVRSVVEGAPAEVEFTSENIEEDADFQSIALDIDGKEHFVFVSAISTIA